MNLIKEIAREGKFENYNLNSRFVDTKEARLKLTPKQMEIFTDELESIVYERENEVLETIGHDGEFDLVEIEHEGAIFNISGEAYFERIGGMRTNSHELPNDPDIIEGRIVELKIN